LKKNIIGIFILSFVFIFVSCTVQSKETKPYIKSENKNEEQIPLNIVTTNKFLYNMVKDISKDKNNIEYMFTKKDELFNFNYSKENLDYISKKDIFFYFGNAMEPWIENFINELNKNKVAPVNISRGVKIIQLERGILYKDKTINDNPYFWSNTENYKIAMLNIKNALQDKDTKNRDIYEKNFNDLIKEIDGYEKELKNITEQLKDYTFIVDGDELDYFIKNYGLNSLKLYNYGLVLTEEDKKKISDLEEKIKGNNNIIFLYDNEEKLKANDFLIKKYNINTLNIISYKDDINYKDMLKYNLKNLETLLQNIQLKEESKKADVNQ